MRIYINGWHNRLMASEPPDVGLVLRPSRTLVQATPPEASSRARPPIVYLSKLAPGSRRTMARALTTVAELGGYTVESLDWAFLRYAQTQAIRARLMESHSPAGVNKIL